MGFLPYKIHQNPWVFLVENSGKLEKHKLWRFTKTSNASENAAMFIPRKLSEYIPASKFKAAQDPQWSSTIVNKIWFIKGLTPNNLMRLIWISRKFGCFANSCCFTPCKFKLSPHMDPPDLFSDPPTAKGLGCHVDLLTLGRLAMVSGVQAMVSRMFFGDKKTSWF